MSTCRDCHKTWTGLRAGHCTVCHETFGSADNDKHWTRNGHVHPSELPDRYHQDAKGIWRLNGSFPRITEA